MPLLRIPHGKVFLSNSELIDSTAARDHTSSHTRSLKTVPSHSRPRTKRRRTSTRTVNIHARADNSPNNKAGNFTAGSSFSKPPSFPPSPCSFFKCIIKDNDPAVHYSGVWVLNGTQLSTTHSTTDSSASISLRFNGSAITVFGIVPKSSDELKPPTAVYKIDDQTAFATTLPRAEAPIMNQPLFASTGKLSDEEHLLTIEVTDAPTPYTIASFFVVPPSNLFKDMMMITPQNSSVTGSTTTSSSAVSASRTMQAVSTSPSSTEKWSENAQKTIKVLAAILALITCLMIAGGVLFFIVRRRNKSKEKAQKQILNPVVSCPHAEKARPDTVYTSFTTTESILRNDDRFWTPSLRSPRSHTRSDGPRSDSRSRSVASEGRRSGFDLSPPPLPPKPGLFYFTETKLGS